MNTLLNVEKTAIETPIIIDKIRTAYEVNKWDIGEALVITKHDIRLALMGLLIQNLESTIADSADIKTQYKSSLIAHGLQEPLNLIYKEDRKFEYNRIHSIIEMFRDKFSNTSSDYFKDLIAALSSFIINGCDILTIEEQQAISLLKEIVIEMFSLTNLYHNSDKELDIACVVFSTENILQFLNFKYSDELNRRWGA